MNPVYKRFVAALLLLFAAGLVSPFMHSAAPVRGKILEEVQVGKDNGELFIDVQFSFPLRYRSHFPQHRGEELRIQLQPVLVPISDADALVRRESVVPRYAEAVAVEEVIYEGDIEGGPYLTVRFCGTAGYEVIPGPDYRSVRIMVISTD